MKSPNQKLRPDSARVVLTLGLIMFQVRPSGNGEGLENRVFFCSGNLLNSLDLLTDRERM
jgi:hypothetical protein